MEENEGNKYIKQARNCLKYSITRMKARKNSTIQGQLKCMYFYNDSKTIKKLKQNKME